MNYRTHINNLYILCKGEARMHLAFDWYKTTQDKGWSFDWARPYDWDKKVRKHEVDPHHYVWEYHPKEARHGRPLLKAKVLILYQEHRAHEIACEYAAEVAKR